MLTSSNQNIKDGLEGHAASWYSDVFDLVFPDLDSRRANSVWKEQLAESEKESNKLEDDE